MECGSSVHPCAAFRGLEYDNPDRPEATNLIAIYSLVTGMSTVRQILPRGVHQKSVPVSALVEVLVCAFQMRSAVSMRTLNCSRRCLRTYATSFAA